jgi:hypothetical protein
LLLVFDDVGAATILATTPESSVPIVSIDSSIGMVRPIVNTSVESAAFGFSAFDRVARHLYFLSGSLGARQFVDVDLRGQLVTTSLGGGNAVDFVFCQIGDLREV